jgi:hypothetical protein
MYNHVAEKFINKVIVNEKNKTEEKPPNED